MDEAQQAGYADAGERVSSASSDIGDRGHLGCHSKVWFDRGGHVASSEWRVALLEAVEQTGFLAMAAQSATGPYRTAWYKLAEMEHALGIKPLSTQSGGHDGGRGDLTEEARELRARFHRVTRGLEQLVAARFKDEFGDFLDWRRSYPRLLPIERS